MQAVALHALDLQARRFLGLNAVVAAEPAPAVVAGCALETFHTAAGTWVLCPQHGWYAFGAPLPVCPFDGR